MQTTTTTLPRNMRGARWFNEASYITDEQRQRVVQAVETAKSCVDDPRTIGVRCPSYIGEPHPICCITHGPGGSRLYGSVH